MNRDHLSAGMQAVVRAAGSTTMVVIAALVVVGYLVIGAVRGFSDR